jgi:TonB family protein
MNASVYAKPVLPRIVFRPALVTLALHALMIFGLTVNWSSSDKEVTRVKPAPKVINARLVDISEFRPKPQPTPKKPAPVVKPRPKPVVKVKPAPAPKVAAPKPKVKTKPKVETKPEPKAESRMSTDALAALAQAELSQAVASEEQATADQMTASFTALIQQTVINYWSRPPSARNGMETELSIQLIPTGEVVSVSVVRSSGNAAFDRAAVNAVQKAAGFPELQKLPNREFERNFRRFRLLFRPEDLRY